MSYADLVALLDALRAHGVTKYETPDLCLELTAAWSPGVGPVANPQSPEEDDFDPAKAYEASIQEAAAAIAAAAAKRE